MTSILNKESTIVILTYAPWGFGHLRVTDALYHGLPEDITPVLLGSQDTSISNIYRFVSIHPLTRGIMEWGQNGFAEDIFAYFYRYYLLYHVKTLYQQFVTILEQRIDLPDTILVIATHFGLAHQLSAIKEKLEKERKIRIILILQITDDSPQKLWYVPGVDLIFAPSLQTVRELESYAKHRKLPYSKMLVNPYPVSPLFAKQLTHEDYIKRKEQLDPQNHSLIHILIPLSGAAVGTTFFSTLIREVIDRNNRFKFHVIAKSAPYTQNFLQTILAWQSVELQVSVSDREVVNMYEEAYMKEIISLEVSKPSEQAFKSLLNPRRRGGVILLFSEPVGRQEFDNLDFLQRHEYIPTKSEHHRLLKKAESGELIESDDDLYKKANHWRGLVLPADPKRSAKFIVWALKSNLLLQMVQKKDEEETDEISPHGVDYFWKKVREFLEEKKRANNI